MVWIGTRNARAISSALAIGLLAAGSPVSAAAPQTLAKAIDQILAGPGLAHTSFGIEVYDLRTKRVIYAMNGTKFFKPASTT